MSSRLVPYPSAETPEGPIGATVQSVIDTLFSRIEAKEYEVDERLPSERTLAAELGVARNTVREALDVLETRRVIRRRAGSGSFLAKRGRAEFHTLDTRLEHQPAAPPGRARHP